MQKSGIDNEETRTESYVPDRSEKIEQPESIRNEACSPSEEGSTVEGDNHDQKRDVEESDETAIHDMILELKSVMQELAKDFELKLKYDATKQKQIDKLYDENLQYKDGIIRKFQNSIILAVIEQIDEASKQIAYFEQAEFSEENFHKILRSYRDITSGFQDVLLEKFDVENYTCTSGDRFDPKQQRSLKTTPTENPDRNKSVKQSLRPGYRDTDGHILRPELVEVYVYNQAQAGGITG